MTDTDVPNLSVSLALSTISESGGSVATTGTVTRDLVSDLPIVVDLSVPAGSPVTVPASVTIPANQASANFNIGAFNNNSPEIVQAVTITAEVTTMTNGSPLTQGSGSATLYVVNNSGPTLDVTFANPVVVQGEASATTGTVTIENASAPTSPVTVTLSSSVPTSATVPPTVTIPAGATSATFTIATPADTQDLGTVEPTINASATSYAPATAQLIVTDTSLPDLIVSGVTTAATALNGQIFHVNYTVSNQGTAPAVGPWEDQIYITNQPTGGVLTPLGSPLPFNGTMQPGLFYTQSIAVFAPEQTGTYWLVVETDTGNAVTEAINTTQSAVSAQPIQILPSYTATVQAETPVAVVNTPIPLTGTASLAGGGPAAFDLVNIHIFTQGTERIISALTDANGKFSTDFQPLPGEAGVYSIGATNPGVSQATVQSGFEILGMSAQPPSASLSLIAKGPTAGGDLTLTNLTNIALSNVQATVVGAPSNLQVAVTVGNGTADQQLLGMGTLTLGYDVTASDMTTPSGTFTIDVSSAEGATVEVPVSFTVMAQVPHLVASPTTLQAGMLIGSQTILQVTLDNQGGASTGPLEVLLPGQGQYPFLSLGSPADLDSIAPGGSIQVTLLLTPPSDMPLGTYTDTIVVQGASSDTTIPFTFLNQSRAVGEMDITTVDEFTYFAQGSPNLAGASITVTSSLTGDVVATGTTDANGELDLPNLPEGYYQVSATAPDHSGYDNTVLIGAGQTTNVTAFLSRQAVQYSFTVLPTSVQDNIQVQVEHDVRYQRPRAGRRGQPGCARRRRPDAGRPDQGGGRDDDQLRTDRRSGPPVQHRHPPVLHDHSLDLDHRHAVGGQFDHDPRGSGAHRGARLVDQYRGRVGPGHR